MSCELSSHRRWIFMKIAHLRCIGRDSAKKAESIRDSAFLAESDSAFLAESQIDSAFLSDGTRP